MRNLPQLNKLSKPLQLTNRQTTSSKQTTSEKTGKLLDSKAFYPDGLYQELNDI